jgi:protein subunit release factor A
MTKKSKGDLLFSVTLKDCEVQEFRAGGPGGQKQNKTSSGVRVIHHPSGARGESREQRSQLQNKRTAFVRMTETAKFKVWLNREIMVRNGIKTPEERVEEDMRPENLRVEIKSDGKWVEG